MRLLPLTVIVLLVVMLMSVFLASISEVQAKPFFVDRQLNIAEGVVQVFDEPTDSIILGPVVTHIQEALLRRPNYVAPQILNMSKSDSTEF